MQSEIISFISNSKLNSELEKQFIYCWFPCMLKKKLVHNDSTDCDPC